VHLAVTDLQLLLDGGEAVTFTPGMNSYSQKAPCNCRLLRPNKQLQRHLRLGLKDGTVFKESFYVVINCGSHTLACTDSFFLFLSSYIVCEQSNGR